MAMVKAKTVTEECRVAELEGRTTQTARTKSSTAPAHSALSETQPQGRSSRVPRAASCSPSLCLSGGEKGGETGGEGGSETDSAWPCCACAGPGTVAGRLSPMRLRT